jgi:hypothetical protein
MLRLELTKNSDPRLRESMARHYSRPLGFVGRNICYAITFDDNYYGHTVAGSATLHLPNRKEFLCQEIQLNSVVNNTYFHVEKLNGEYPTRNFVTKIVAAWRQAAQKDWFEKYGDEVFAFETLVELPRTGDCYLRDGWTLIGQTKGFTCKRTAGKGTDSWSGKRIWNTKELKPKLVFMKLCTSN